jgi:hypothetical protein
MRQVEAQSKLGRRSCRCEEIRTARKGRPKRDTRKGTKTCPLGSLMVSVKSIFWNEWRALEDDFRTLVVPEYVFILQV